MKYLSIILTFITAFLSFILKLRKEDSDPYLSENIDISKTKSKSFKTYNPTSAGWIIILIMTLSFTFSIIMQYEEDKKSENTAKELRITNDRLLYSAESLQATYRFIITSKLKEPDFYYSKLMSAKKICIGDTLCTFNNYENLYPSSKLAGEESYNYLFDNITKLTISFYKDKNHRPDLTYYFEQEVGNFEKSHDTNKETTIIYLRKNINAIELYVRTKFTLHGNRLRIRSTNEIPGSIVHIDSNFYPEYHEAKLISLLLTDENNRHLIIPIDKFQHDSPMSWKGEVPKDSAWINN